MTVSAVLVLDVSVKLILVVCFVVQTSTAVKPTMQSMLKLEKGHLSNSRALRVCRYSENRRRSPG